MFNDTSTVGHRSRRTFLTDLIFIDGVSMALQFITGSIARSANLPVFRLLIGQF